MLQTVNDIGRQPPTPDSRFDPIMAAPQIKRDVNRSGWEKTDFPSVCERCLPDNPYVQMLKEDHGAECKVSRTMGRWRERVESIMADGNATRSVRDLSPSSAGRPTERHGRNAPASV